MTDISKYKNVSLPKDTYNKIDKIRKVIVPEMTISRSQTITLLVNEKEKKLNGRLKKTVKLSVLFVMATVLYVYHSNRPEKNNGLIAIFATARVKYGRI